jgi:hypothetical protein
VNEYDVETAYKMLPSLEEARRKLRCARTLKALNIEGGMNRELADYDPPSNIGVAFRKIRAALIELHEKELAACECALKGFGVETPPTQGDTGE